MAVEQQRTTGGQWQARQLAGSSTHRCWRLADPRDYRSRTRAIADDHDLAPHAVEQRSKEAREQARRQMQDLRAECVRERGEAILTVQRTLLGTAQRACASLETSRAQGHACMRAWQTAHQAALQNATGWGREDWETILARAAPYFHVAYQRDPGRTCGPQRWCP